MPQHNPEIEPVDQLVFDYFTLSEIREDFGRNVPAIDGMLYSSYQNRVERLFPEKVIQMDVSRSFVEVEMNEAVEDGNTTRALHKHAEVEGRFRQLIIEAASNNSLHKPTKWTGDEMADYPVLVFSMDRGITPIGIG